MEPVYFVHISDTHFGPTPDYARQGHASLPYARKIVDIINRLPLKPDFVMHTGDVVTHPSDEAYRLAAETFAALEVPVYYATGNHDRSRDIHRFLTLGPRQDCDDDENTLSYTFEVKGHRFLVLDARGPDEIDPHGLLSPSQLEVLRREAVPEGPPLTIFTHYPAVYLNSPWMDANMLILNGHEMHNLLVPIRDRLRAVFYGHVHSSMQTLRDGVVYCCVGSTFAGFTTWPNEEMIQADRHAMPAFNFVQLLPEQTIIQQKTFRRLVEEGPR